MYGKIKKSIALTIAAACTLSACACGGDNDGCVATARSDLLGKPSAAQPLTYEQNQDESFCSFKSGVENFSAKLAVETYSGKNYAISPVSVYMALALAAECADGRTRTEILNALGTDYGTLENNIPLLFCSIENEYKTYSYENNEKIEKSIGMIKLGNSIWIDDGSNVKQSCIDKLADDYYCYSYSADFKHDNASANQAVREFVAEQTRGLIDQDFDLDVNTMFALINTLYLKDVWREHGDDLPMTNEKYTFIGKNSNKDVRYLLGYYNNGRTYTTDEYSAFYTSTANGNKLKFIVPNDGYTIDQVFTAENIHNVNTYDFGSNAVDHDNKLIYRTNCVFPEYRAKFDDDIAPVLKNKFGIKQFFDGNTCDFSPLTTNHVHCSQVKHVTNLTVDKKGIEGAAVTVELMAGDSAPIHTEYKNVYETFLVEKSFGFIITNYYGTTLFSGVIADL